MEGLRWPPGDPRQELITICLIRLLHLLFTPPALTWFPLRATLCEVVNSFKHSLRAVKDFQAFLWTSTALFCLLLPPLFLFPVYPPCHRKEGLLWGHRGLVSPAERSYLLNPRASGLRTLGRVTLSLSCYTLLDPGFPACSSQAASLCIQVPEQKTSLLFTLLSLTLSLIPESFQDLWTPLFWNIHSDHTGNWLCPKIPDRHLNKFL
jgi:hypothetical protein